MESAATRSGREPVGRSGLGGDHCRQTMLAVGQYGEQVVGGFGVDAHGEEVVDDQ